MEAGCMIWPVYVIIQSMSQDEGKLQMFSEIKLEYKLKKILKSKIEIKTKNETFITAFESVTVLASIYAILHCIVNTFFH